MAKGRRRNAKNQQYQHVRDSDRTNANIAHGGCGNQRASKSDIGGSETDTECDCRREPDNGGKAEEEAGTAG